MKIIEKIALILYSNIILILSIILCLMIFGWLDIETVGNIVEKGLTQEKLAEKIGMSQNTMSSRICGRSSFRVDEVKKICCILGIESSEEKAKIFLS